VVGPADDTRPVITPSIVGTLGNNGWYVSDVKVTWTVSDPESTVTSTTGCDSTTISTDTNGTTLTCTATSAGGTSIESVTIKRDATAPTVSLVDGPVDGASYYFGSVPAAPTCEASDDTSGLAGPCSVSYYGTTVGKHTVKASATDNAGNSNSASATYTVLAWKLDGFYAPVDMGSVLNSVKKGSTVPLKWRVWAGENEITDVAEIVSVAYKSSSCTAMAEDAVEEVVTTGGTVLRYDATGRQFINNWKSPTSLGCWTVTMTTADGSKLSALFKTK
jgi:hypothetical protein